MHVELPLAKVSQIFVGNYWFFSLILFEPYNGVQKKYHFQGLNKNWQLVDRYVTRSRQNLGAGLFSTLHSCWAGSQREQYAVKYGIVVLRIVLPPARYLAVFLRELLRRCCLVLLASEDSPSTNLVAPNSAPLPGGSGRSVNAEIWKKVAEG